MAASMPTPGGARGLSVRYACLYAALFLTIGIYMPFWPLWLARRGLSPEGIGIILAVGSWSRVIANPVMARIADRRQNSKAMLVLLSATALLVFTGFFPARGFWLILVINLAAAMAHTPIMPLAESRTMAAVLRHRLDYGRIRLWGSLAFILGTAGAGWIIQGRDPDIILLLILIGLAATLASALALPAGDSSERPRPGGMRILLTDRGFMTFLCAAALLQASHAAYYGFSSLHWRASGLSEASIGWLWAVGVIAEVLLFATSGGVLSRLGARGLLGVSATAGMVRWVVMGATTEPTALIASQVLHAATFGAAHLGTMHFIARHAPAGQAASAQALFSVLSGGLAMSAAMWAAGRLYAVDGSVAFLAMAALSALAGALVLGLRLGGVGEDPASGR